MAMTVKSGRWSDPTVWDTGVVPGAGAMAHIKAPHQIIYDRESDVILEDVMSEMGSKLTWDAAKETRLRANTIMLSGITEIVDKGPSATPSKPKHEIVFHPVAGKDPGAGMGLGAVFMGPTRIHGYAKKGHLRAGNLSIPAGATTIHVPGLATSGWQVGDELVILGTEYVLPATSDPQYTGPTSYWGASNGSTLRTISLNEYQFGQDEQRTITAISGDTITLNAPLDYAHTGMTGTLKDGKVITVRPVITNVSRSIRFRTATAEEDGQLDPGADITVLQKRAHLMFMRQPDTDVRYFETKNMGRTSTDPSLVVEGTPYKVEMAGGTRTVDKILASDGGAPLENPNNVRGRYSIHLHWCGGPYLSSPQVNLIGATAWAPIGGHPIPGWAITHHATRAAIEDCVVSNVRGAGMVSEIGNELGQWVNNVVTGCRGDGSLDGWGSRMETHANHNGSTGVAYENQSRAILQKGNIAGSSKYGWLYHHQKDNRIKRSPRDVDLRFVEGLQSGASTGVEVEPGSTSLEKDDLYGMQKVQIPPFTDNEAHACRIGFSVFHRGGNDIGPDKTPLLMERFHCLNVPFAWEVPQYSNTYYQKDCLFQGPINMMDVSKAVLMGDVSWDWNFANIHIRNYLFGFFDDGAGWNYDGQLIDITTENVTNFTNAPYRTFTGASTHAVKNIMGDWEDHPTDPNRARIRRYRSLDSATELPTPYPLAPYGRKLPANKPDGTPYPPVNPGDTPYFVLGDGTNGEASTVPVAINLGLSAGRGRDRGAVYGIIRDSVGDRRWPDWQNPETFPNNISVKSHRSLALLAPEQLVQRWGCWSDSGTWKCRVWFMGADRFTHVRFSFSVDFTLSDFEPEFLARHDIGGPSVAPEWPDKLEAVPAPRPLTPISKNLKFLSRARLEVVEGQALSHRLRPNDVLTNLSVVGGTDAALFKVENQRLVWAGAGAALRAQPYEVTIRATDGWGNTIDAPHEVIVVPSARVSAQIVDNFNRADENLETNPAYVRLTGSEGVLAIKTNALAVNAGSGAVYDLGSLGTSEQDIRVTFQKWADGQVLFRMVDERNWLGFRRHDATTSFQLQMCIEGTITEIARFSSVGAVLVEARCQDRKLLIHTGRASTVTPKVWYPINQGTAPLKLFDLDPLGEPGALLLPANAPRGTKVGLRATSSSVNPWIDNFSAKALES